MDKSIKEYIESIDYTKEIIEFLQSVEVNYKGKKYVFNIGDKINRLEIIFIVRYRENSGAVRKGCICKCSCKKIIGPIRINSILSGDNISCGCYSSEIHSKILKSKNLKHGYNIRNNRSRLYNIWAAMLRRCRALNTKDAKYYSLKGITVCKEWEIFENFKNWALKNGYRDGLTIDRKNNSLGYSPDNCRFITIQEQQLNKTSVRIIKYNGISDSVSGWSKRIGISYETLLKRLKKYENNIGKALGFE